jgi:hypothetical protein
MRIFLLPNELRFILRMTFVLFALVYQSPAYGKLTLAQQLCQKEYSWLSYVFKYQQEMEQHFQREIRLYRELRDRGDEMVLALERLGFRGFKPGETIHVPTFEEMIARYNAEIDRIVASDPKRYPANSVLRAARVFRDPEGKAVFIPYGEPIPRGLGLVPEEKIFESDVWIDMLAQGYLPIAEVVYNLVTRRAPNIWHDIAHFTGNMDHPDYMVALVEEARRVQKFYGSLTEKAKEKFGERLYAVSEQAILVPPEHMPALQKIFDLHASMPAVPPAGSVYLYKNVLEHVEKLSPATIELVADDLHRNGLSLVKSLGGLRRDVILNDHYGSFVGAGAGLDHGLWVALERNNWIKLNFEQKVSAVAAYQTLLANAGRITARDWVEGSLQREVNPNSMIHKFMCAGVGTKADTFYPQYIFRNYFEAYCVP